MFFSRSVHTCRSHISVLLLLRAAAAAATAAAAAAAAAADAASAAVQSADSSSNTVHFWGFYDGSNTWRQRFMPSQLGVWTYSWAFSDGSLKGEGHFECILVGAGPGVLGPYKPNPHWFAYSDGTPKFIKSYYNKAGGLTRQDSAWTVEHFYSKLVARGYNHHMNSGFLPVLPLSALWDGQPFADGPAAINQTIYTDPKSPSTSMSLDVWRELEGQLAYLNNHNVTVDFFEGFNAQGPGAGDISWSAMSEDTKRWWVSYVIARLGAYANIGGFQYAWESDGSNVDTSVSNQSECGHPQSRCGDYQLALLLQELDPWSHMRTYEEENATLKNHIDLPAWSFASVEALGEGDVRLCGCTNHSAPCNSENCTGGSTQNHHDIALQGYRGKPVYMCEGHDLWRSWWHALEPNVVRAAWAVTTAAASFTWADIGHFPDDPYSSIQLFSTYPRAAKAMDVHAHIMTEVLPAFYLTVPADDLIGQPAPPLTFCLAERGRQYLVYSDAGAPFYLDTLDSGAATDDRIAVRYNATWFDAESGAEHAAGQFTAGFVHFTPPKTGKHWVAVIVRL
eukprot:COSAG02_NODE_6673_length_3424_cov_4.259994_1_plen_564_part_00